MKSKARSSRVASQEPNRRHRRRGKREPGVLNWTGPRQVNIVNGRACCCKKLLGKYPNNLEIVLAVVTNTQHSTKCQARMSLLQVHSVCATRRLFRASHNARKNIRPNELSTRFTITNVIKEVFIRFLQRFSSVHPSPDKHFPCHVQISNNFPNC